MPDPKTLAGQLKEAANLLEVLGDDPNRARAFQNAARNLEAFEGDFAALYADGRLTDIRGIGAGLAAELQAVPDGGALPLLAELRERVPPGVRELFRVSGLGAKKIRALWSAGVDGLEALEAAVDDGRVAALKGFGAKSAEKFREGARFALAAKRRLRLDQAEALAVAIAEALTAELPDARVTAAGELRRGCETVGGLELLVTRAPAEALARFARERLGAEPDPDLDLDPDPSGVAPAGAAAAGGDAWTGAVEGRRVRLVRVHEDAFGAALALRTGNAAFAGALRARAAERGLALRPDGVFEGGARRPVADEAALFALLERPLVAPELREEADPAAVPDLIEAADVRGLVHNHSTWSDAVHSIREMVAAARARGYAYLAMADHSRSSYYANGLSIERVRSQAAEIREIRAELAAEGSDFELLHGIEVDILPDGELDYPDEVLAELDYAVVSVHQHFTLSEAAQTERIVRAVHNPHASILGHASGRLLLRRPPYPVDLAAVIDACAATGTVIEINASPYRLDMDWRWLRRARDAGCRFSIDPDAHHVDGFDDVRFGVTVARKAGLRPAEVVNTAPSGRAFLARLKGDG